jgi:hypothetical protein
MTAREGPAADFVSWLEDRGARWCFRRGEDWWLNLNGVPDMTQAEAEAITAAAFEIRDEIRAVLLGRRAATRPLDSRRRAPVIGRRLNRCLSRTAGRHV